MHTYVAQRLRLIYSEVIHCSVFFARQVLRVETMKRSASCSLSLSLSLPSLLRRRSPHPLPSAACQALSPLPPAGALSLRSALSALFSFLFSQTHLSPSSPPPSPTRSDPQRLHANENERKRMQQINEGFEELRALLPGSAGRLPKVRRAGCCCNGDNGRPMALGWLEATAPCRAPPLVLCCHL